MPELDLSRRIVYRVEGAANAIVRPRIAYTRDQDGGVLMDVYAPATPSHAGGSPALVFVHGGPIPREMLPPRQWGCFAAYGELAAASGLVGVVFNHRLYAPTDYALAESDMKAAIEHVRANALDLGIDPAAIGVWTFSGGGPLVSWCLRERPAYLRCLLSFYAMLDVRHLLPADPDPELVRRALAFSAAAQLEARPTSLPMFVARAGLDLPTINGGVDAFVRAALAGNAPLDLMNHATGHHAFDILDDNDRSREIIAGAVAFAQRHLLAAVAHAS